MPLSLCTVSESFPYTLTSMKELLLLHSRRGWMLGALCHPDYILPSLVILSLPEALKSDIWLLVNPSHRLISMAPELLANDIQKQPQYQRLSLIVYKHAEDHVSSRLGLVPKHNGGYRRFHSYHTPKATQAVELFLEKRTLLMRSVIFPLLHQIIGCSILYGMTCISRICIFLSIFGQPHSFSINSPKPLSGRCLPSFSG